MERTYESMFIVDPAVAAKEWNRITEELEGTFSRYGGKILNLRKWGERKLTFPIRRQQRGTYVLAYCSGPSDLVIRVRGDLELSEVVLRYLIVRHEGPIEGPPQDVKDRDPQPESSPQPEPEPTPVPDHDEGSGPRRGGRRSRPE